MAETDIIDGTVRNQVLLRRYLRREAREMLELIESYDREVARVLRRRWQESMKLGSGPLKKLYEEIREIRDEMIKAANKKARGMVKELAPVERDREWLLLLLLLGLKGRKPKNPKVSDILNTPFASGPAAMSTYRQWLDSVMQSDRRRIQDTLMFGATNSVTKQEMLELMVGTSAKRFTDGKLTRTRQNMEALVETLVTHTSLTAREQVWRSSKRIVGAQWVSVLDSRTTLICAGRDGKIVMYDGNPLPEGAIALEPSSARPPAHVRCRSTMAALRRGPIPDRRDYEDWLRSQSENLQNEILGKTKAGMFRRGEISLDRFVDESGRELTIQQLREQ